MPADRTPIPLTPAQLRRRARDFLAQARTLLRGNHFDGAAYQASFAVELALKARICSALGWPDFPEDRAVERSRLAEAGVPRGQDRVRIHDLRELMKLADVDFARVVAPDFLELERVLDWHNEDRYQVFAEISESGAQKRVAAASHFLDEVALLDLVDRLRLSEERWSREFGPFVFFALIKDAAPPNLFRCVVAAWWLPPASPSGIKEESLRRRYLNALGDDDYREWVPLVIASPLDEPIPELIAGLQRTVNQEMGFDAGPFAIEHFMMHVTKMTLNGGILPDFVAITIAHRPRPVFASVQHRSSLAPVILRSYQ